MKTTLKSIIFFALVIMMTGCFRSSARPVKSQLEIRQMQTHVYDVCDFKMVMKAMINVLQDESYVVKNVQLDVGFLNATKETDIENSTVRFWLGMLGTSDNTRFAKMSQIDVTANVTEFGKRTKVRANFQFKKLDNYGNVIAVYQIQDPEFYQNFFSKVSKSIFIQEENI